ncbi:MAG: beta-lactamase family protein [Anaerolineales bacterium]|nr:beta-lactamase family protein [Anaerolineales bacterium]
MTVPHFASVIENEVLSPSVPSCAYAVVAPDGIVTSGAVGLADLAQSRPVTVDTAYHLFSATKLYTATAVMQLVETSKISLDTPFTKILPEYRSDALDGITIKHLLSHTSGLPDTIPAVIAVRRIGESVPVIAEVLKRYNLKPRRKSGMKVEYRNVNYMILGEVIERISGRSYVDYVTGHILQPLGMQAAFTYTDTMKTDMATGYISRWDPTLLAVRLTMPGMRWVIGERIGRLVAMRPYDLDSVPIGGLIGSVLQFAPFLIAHLNNGKGILCAESALQMREMAATGQAGFDAKIGMGLGWKIGESNGAQFFNHEGGGAGFATETRIYPDKRLGIMLLTNGYGTRVHRALYRVCETVYQMIQE